MADQFIDVIANEIINYANITSLVWHVHKQKSPNRKEYDCVPMVIITPSGKDNVRFMSFCGLTIESSYDVFLVSQGDLSSDFGNSADVFQKAIIGLFMPQPPSMATAGSWQVRVKPKYDYDRGIYPQGYSVSALEIVVYWLF